MDETISTIRIEIGASSEKAVTEINKITNSIRNLRRESNQKIQNPLKNVSAVSGAPVTKNIAKSVDAAKIAKELGRVDRAIETTERKLDALQTKLETLQMSQKIGSASASGRFANSDIQQVEAQLQEVSKIYDALDAQRRDIVSRLNTGGDTMMQSVAADSDKAEQKVRKLSDVLRNIRERVKLRIDASDADKAKKKVGALANIFNSLKRITFYRVIRSAIKGIGQAFSEGAENAYWYAKTIGDQTKYIADAYDNLASGSFKMQNQLGAAWATLKSAITPILLEIVRLVTMAANALTQFFSILGGKGTYLKAIDYSKDWADATAAGAASAKEWKNQLMGFDEINRLEEPSTGGGGGGSALSDYGNMFEEAELDDRLKRLAEKIQEFGASLKLSIKDVVFNWDNLNPEQIVEKVIVGLGGILGAAAGFILGGVPGAVVGTLIGVSVGLVIDSLIFDHDGTIGKQEIGEMLRLALFGLVGGIIGFSLGGPAGALLGATVGVGVYGLLKGLAFLSEMRGSWALNSLADGISAGLGGVIGFKIGGPAGALLGATIGLGISFGLRTFVFGDTSGWTTATWLRNIVAALSPFAGAAIGRAVGGPLGAAIGATIGLGIHFLLKTDSSADGENVVEGFFQGIIDKISTVGEWLKPNVWEPFKEGFKKAFGIASPAKEMKPFGGYIWEGVLQGILGAITGIGEWLKTNVWEPFKAAFDNIFNLDALKEWGSNIVSGIGEGISNAWSGVKNFFGGIFGGKDQTVSAPTVEMPAVDMGWMEAISAAADTAISKVTTAKITISAAFATIKSNVTTTGTAISNNIKTTWTQINTTVSGKVSAFKTNVTNTFDTVKTNVSDKVKTIQENTINGFDSVKTKVGSSVTALKTALTTDFGTIKTNLYNAVTSTKENTVNTFTSMKTTLTSVVSSISAGMSTSFSSIQSTITNSVNTAKNNAVNAFQSLLSSVQSIVSSIRSAFNFNWQFPSIKLPHLNWTWRDITGTTISKFLGENYIPNFSVSWYAKGGIVDGATLIGAGEAGKEAIIPLERNTEWISKVAREMNTQQGSGESISDGIEESGVVSVLYQILSVAQDISRSDSSGGDVDFDAFVRRVTKTQRQQARAAG